MSYNNSDLTIETSKNLSYYKKKLDKQRETRKRLEDSLKKTNEITSNTCKILGSFDQDLCKLENNFKPICDRVNEVKTAMSYMDSCIKELYKTKSYYEATGRLSGKIELVPPGDIKTYLGFLSEVKTAENFFTEVNKTSEYLPEITKLRIKGIENIDNHFKSIVSKFSTVNQSPDALSSFVSEVLINPYEVTDVTSDRFRQSIHNIPNDEVENLQSLVKWMSVYSAKYDQKLLTEWCDLYVRSRSSFIVNCLHRINAHILFIQDMAEYQSTYFQRGQTTRLTDFSKFTRKASHAIGQSLKVPNAIDGGRGDRKRSSGSKFFFSSVSESPTSSPMRGGSGSSPLAISDFIRNPDILRQHVLSLKTILSCFLHLCNSEINLLMKIFPFDQYQVSSLFAKMSGEASDLVTSQMESLKNTAEQLVIKSDKFIISIEIICEIYAHVTLLEPQACELLEMISERIPSSFASFVKESWESGWRIFSRFLDFLKPSSGHHPDKSQLNLPSDGTVHELTAITITIFHRFYEYREAAGGIILARDPQALPRVRIQIKKECSLSLYLVDCLGQLTLNLTKKSDSYTHDVLRAIFMLNNEEHILKAVRKRETELGKLIHLSTPELEDDYRRKVEQHKKVINHSFQKLLSFIRESSSRKNMITAGKHLHDREKRNIKVSIELNHSDPPLPFQSLLKDRFSNFNREFDDIHRVLSRYSIPSPTLRAEVIKTISDLVVRCYEIFYVTYEGLPFTENKPKYVKYSPEGLRNAIGGLFSSKS